ncbi:MAG: hypothetical protein U0Y82_12740 [Thermoleophilia bacterium]
MAAVAAHWPRIRVWHLALLVWIACLSAMLIRWWGWAPPLAPVTVSVLGLPAVALAWLGRGGRRGELIVSFTAFVVLCVAVLLVTAEVLVSIWWWLFRTGVS